MKMFSPEIFDRISQVVFYFLSRPHTLTSFFRKLQMIRLVENSSCVRFSATFRKIVHHSRSILIESQALSSLNNYQ